jgi:sec-independent protein translocase protein TatB
MNIFGVGPLEFAVILIVALVFVGPDRLPRFAADLARTIREIRKYTGSLAAEFNEVIKDVEKETAGEKGLWKEVSQGIGGATQQVTDAVRGARQEMFKATDESVTASAPTPSVSRAQPANGNGAGHWVDIPEPAAAPNGPVSATEAEPEKAPEQAS